MDHSDEIEERPPHEIIDFLHGNGIDTEFSAICRRHRFVVRISESDLHEDTIHSPNIESVYKRLLTALSNDDPSGIEDLNPEDYDPLEVMYNWVATPFFPLFRQLPSINEASEELQTLHQYANPPKRFFQLKALGGKLVPVPDETGGVVPSSLLPSLQLTAPLAYTSFPTFSPRDIQIPWDSMSEGALYPRTVLLNSSQRFYFRSADDPDSAKREIDILGQILQLGLNKIFRLPKLHAYVKYDNEASIVGYLLEYIEHQNVLSERIAQNAPESLRRNWYRTIADTVRALHDAGIVWGDAKAENVLIDHENRAWVIDFGGGHTEGWVDQDLTETVAGDLQGLSRIREYLNLC